MIIIVIIINTIKSKSGTICYYNYVSFQTHDLFILDLLFMYEVQVNMPEVCSKVKKEK